MVDRTSADRSDELLPPVAPAHYVKPELAAALTGYTVKAMQRKIERGDWIEGAEWVKAPDGLRLISIPGFNRWAAGHRK